MTYRGRVKNGVVVLEPPGSLPEGSMVSVRPLKPKAKPEKAKKAPTLYERFKPFIGIAKNLPPDLAENHDHYLHGRPKK